MGDDLKFRVENASRSQTRQSGLSIATQQPIRAAIEKGRAAGADFVEVFIEDTESEEISGVGGKASNWINGRLRGAGVRLLYGSDAYYVSTHDLSEAGLGRAIEHAAAAAAASSAVKATSPNTTHANPTGGSSSAPNFGSPSEANSLSWPKVELPRYDLVLPPTPQSLIGPSRLRLLKRLDQAARSRSSSVTQVESFLLWKRQRVLIANSENLWVEDERPYVRVGVTVTVEDSGQRESAYARLGALASAEWFESVDMESLAVQATERALLMLKADYAPAGEMPVVIDAGFGGVIFHEACGHGLETTSVAKGASVFCGKLGEKVAADCVTAIDDGTLQGGWGSLGCDDEGRATERTVLIENGVLKSYMVDRLGSLRTGYACTGSARRESYRFAPTSRMRNTFIAAGQDSLESMIADIDDGLYAKEMGGGSVSPGTGDFNFSVVEAYRIRRGRVEEAVKGATLVGRGIETLGRITRVGRELRLQDGMCGSVSGTIPAAVGQPPITVSSILVGGRTR